MNRNVTLNAKSAIAAGEGPEEQLGAEVCFLSAYPVEPEVKRLIRELQVRKVEQYSFYPIR